jgi:Carboxypeptidase regulatory-like domain
MRRLALIAIVLASIGFVHCGESPSPPSTGPTQLPTPPAPPPPRPLPTFSISGIVIDGWTQLAMPGVTVSTTGPTRTSTITSADGSYSLTNLSPALYTITLSKPLFRTRTYQSVLVLSDVTHDGRIGLDVQLPYTSDLTGLWVGHGPYRDEPLWLTLIDNGGSFEGWYRDRSSSSQVISGRRDGNAVSLRIDMPGSFLTIEGHFDDPRCLRGVIKNEALGGNFPITFARVAPAFCAG